MPHSTKRLVQVLLACASLDCLCPAAPASAQATERYVLGGGHLAFTRWVPMAGAEVSYVHFDKSAGGLWWGGYTDASVAVDGSAWRHSVGPELGWLFVGADGGLVVRGKGGDWNAGLCARLLATLAFVSTYARADFMPDYTALEMGVLFKWELWYRKGYPSF